MEIVVATQNLGKIREFREMFKPFRHIDLLSLHNFSNYQPPPEEGKSFEEIANQKAIHAAKTLNKWVLADDSGLVVPALDGAPGIFSRRYAGEDATDGENRLKLLQAMKGVTGDSRAAYYACALALASPEGIQKSVMGNCEGYILEEERGRHGFGYDPVFAKHDYDKSFGELDEITKNRISHRRKAFDKMMLFLDSLMSQNL